MRSTSHLPVFYATLVNYVRLPCVRASRELKKARFDLKLQLFPVPSECWYFDLHASNPNLVFQLSMNECSMVAMSAKLFQKYSINFTIEKVFFDQEKTLSQHFSLTRRRLKIISVTRWEKSYFLRTKLSYWFLIACIQQIKLGKRESWRVLRLNFCEISAPFFWR